MKIRIGDRVRLKREGLWGTVVSRHCLFFGRLYIVFVDEDFTTIRGSSALEKLPRYRGIPEARDTQTAMRHLQEYLK